LPLCIDIRRAIALASGMFAFPEISFGSCISGMADIRALWNGNVTDS
jgi:hypothetical protein